MPSSPQVQSVIDGLTLTRIEQRFPRPHVEHVGQAVRSACARAEISIPNGAVIGVGVGSRGVANLATIVRAVIDFLQARGARPFIFPAMGSHGGATAEGQRELLASMGITSDRMGCEVRSSMEVIELAAPELGHRLFMDAHAAASDGIVLINRVKPHTDFHGRYESGLVKMSVIGLGKERQAFEMHNFGTHGLKNLIPKAAEVVLRTRRILMGLAVVENAYDETAFVEAIPGRQILEREPALLEMAGANMARLPVDDIDLLIVDRLGKNISGTGMDTNIIGRMKIWSEPEPERPRIKSIVVTDLTEETHGNATGTGLADVITRRLHSRIDLAVTNKNIVTSGFLERGKIPVIAQTDREAIELGLRGACCNDVGGARIIRIRDTLHLGEVWVSEPILQELAVRSDIKVISGPQKVIESSGALVPFSG